MRSRSKPIVGAALAALVAIACVGNASAQEPPTWAPVASEQLVRLPTGYLEKAIDRDFRDSSLATALRETSGELDSTTRSLGEMQSAAEGARGTARDEMRHRFLVAKREYLALMGARQDLERQRVETRLRLYRRLLKRVERAGDPGDDPGLAALAARRAEAMTRFEDSAGKVDMALFASSTAQESRYAREYRKHATAIRDLVRAIDAHPMNTAPEVDGRAVGKADHLRHLIAQAETSKALLDQKDLVLAYMAKLVALDAMALADEIDGHDGTVAEVRDVTVAVDFFTTPTD